jgi:hypothetical protein
MRIVAAALFLTVTAWADNPFVQAYMPRYNTMKQNLLESADAMPAEQYSFKLSATQRAFGEWVDHTIMLMHNSCGTIKGGTPAAMDHSKHTGDKPKAELVKALKEAAAGCDGAFSGLTDAQALGGADSKPAPVNSMLALLTNMASHYGNMVGYLRAKGITPPSTARAQKK